MSRYLLDENLSRKLSAMLTPVLGVVSHVSGYDLLNHHDGQIWDFAKVNEYTIITKDYDFSDMSHLLGCPPKVIKLNCGNRTTEYICNLLSNKASLIDSFVDSESCYMEIF
jgi:predicted nuclease of predicted toxin-antitoxin system